MHVSRRSRLLVIVAVLALVFTLLPGTAGALNADENIIQQTDITVPSLGNGAPYPSTLTISGMDGLVASVVVDLVITHTNPDDLDIMVVGPSGAKVLLMSDAGGAADIATKGISFRASGALIPDNGPIGNVIQVPSNYGSGDSFPAPAPIGTPSSTMSIFNNTLPNGTWSLFVVDDLGSNSGTILSWTVSVTTAVTFTNAAQITLTSPAGIADPPQFASPYPSTINFPFMAGAIDFIDATLLSVTHSVPNDIDVLLISPSGTKVRLMSDAGGNQAISNVVLHFSNITATQLPSGDGIVSGSYEASNYGAGDDNFAGSGVGGPYEDQMADFLGEHAQGAWKLYVQDDGRNDNGSIGGWSLKITTVNDPPTFPGGIPARTLKEGDTLQFEVTADDAQDDPIALTALQKPSFASFVDNGNGTGTVTLTPPSGTVGTHFMNIGTSDGDSQSSAGFNIEVTDGTPPVTTAVLSPSANAAGWNKTDVAVTLTATDPTPGSGVASIFFNASGANPLASQLENDGQVTLPTFTNEGTTNVNFRGKDNANNTEDFKAQAVKIDKTKPTVTAPKEKFVAVTKLNSDTQVPITAFGWVGSDALSGLKNFSLQQVQDGGAPTQATLPSPLAPSTVRFLAPGHTYKFRIQSVDVAGNGSVVAEGPTFAFDAFQETNGAVTLSFGWTLQSRSFAMGGGQAETSSAARTATLNFTGTDVAWVSTRGSDRGIARVRLDGVIVADVDLFNATLQGRRIVFAADGLTDGPHTLEITVLGTKNASSTGTQVDIDAFLVLNPQ